MPKVLKWGFAVLTGLVLLLAVGVAFVLMFIDPNSFKPKIEKAALQQGLKLTLGGQMAWEFYPEIGIVVKQISVATVDAPEKPLATINEASLSVQVLPLLSGKIAVNGIKLDGLDAKLAKNAEGVGNWEQLAKPAANTPDQPVAGKKHSSMMMAIHHLDIISANVSLDDEHSHQQTLLKNFNLKGTDISFTNKPFTLDINADMELIDAAKNSQKLHAGFYGKLAVPEDFSMVSLSESWIAAEMTSAEKQQKVNILFALTAHLPRELPDGKNQPLLIDSISIDDESTVTQVNLLTKQTMTLHQLSMNAEKIALNSQPFTVKIKTATRLEQPEKPVMNSEIDFSAVITVDEAVNQFTLDDGKLAATVIGEKDKSTIELDMHAKASKEPQTFTAGIASNHFNARQMLKAMGQELPVMKSDTAMTTTSIAMDVEGTDNSVKVDNLKLQLDESQFSGFVHVSDIARQALVADIKGENLNADNYLPPPPVTEAAADTTPAAETGDEVIIPLETLRPLNIKLNLAMSHMTLKNMPFSDFSLVASARDGALKQTMNTKLYDSAVQMTSALDARGDTALIDFDFSAKALPLDNIIKDMAIQAPLGGSSDVYLKGKTRGVRMNELIKATDATLEMAGKELQIKNMNLEQTMCEMIARLQQQPVADKKWDNFTRLQDMTMKMVIKDGVATIQGMSAGVAQISLKSTGSFNLLEKSFDLSMKTRLTNAQPKTTSANAAQCKVTNKSLLNRDFPVRCQGNVASIGAKTCLPDMRVFEGIVKDKLKEGANEAINKALKDKNIDVKSAKDALKGLFNKK